MTQEEAVTKKKLQNAMIIRNHAAPISSGKISVATTFINDILRPDIVGAYRNQVPVLFKTIAGDFRLSYALQKVNPKKLDTVSLAEGLIQASQYAADTYIDQRQFMYKDMYNTTTDNAVACFSMLIDIDNIPDIYDEETDSDKLQFLSVTYPLISTILEPSYIILSGKKGVHLIYCFNQNICSKRFQKSYRILQKALITYFEGDLQRMGINVVRMPYTNRINTDYDHYMRCENPRILYRRSDGSYDYDTFCKLAMACLVQENCLDKEVLVEESHKPIRKYKNRNVSKTSVQRTSGSITKWNSNRVFDIETIVRMRQGHVEGIRDFLLFMYCSAIWNITPMTNGNIEKVETAVRALNNMFAVPGPQPESDIKAVIRYCLKYKRTKGYCPSYRDQYFYELLGLTPEELTHLKNRYTANAKKQHKATYMREYRKQKGKHKGPKKILCTHMNVISRCICNGLSIKTLTDNNIARSTGYKIIGLLNQWKEVASVSSEAAYNDFCTSYMEPQLTDLDRSMVNAFKSLFLHYIKDDLDKWIKTTEGSQLYDILQGKAMIPKADDSSSDPFVTMMHMYGVSDKTIIDYQKKHKKNSYKYICAHPYDGLQYKISIKVCDSIAYNNGVSALSVERINVLTGYILKKNIQNGNTRIPIEQFINAVSCLSKYGPYKCSLPEDIIMKSALEDHSYQIIDGYLTSVDDFEIEKYIAARLIELDASPYTYNTDSAVLYKVESRIGLHLGIFQRSVVTKVLGSSGIHIISGGPGTGKTSVIKAIYEGYNMLHATSGIVLCAQSGKAAVNITEKTGHKATTIHKLLRLQPDEMTKAQLDKKSCTYINAGLIVIDEFSLVDIKLIYLLLKSIAPGTTIVLCGDPDQLSSVGEGNLMYDIISSGKFRHFELKENFRQKNQQNLMENIARIHDGKVPLSYADFRLIQTSSDDATFARLMNIVKNTDMKHTQILCPTYKGIAGIDSLNSAIRMLYGRDLSKTVSNGDHVMFKNSSNNYVNGQTGTIISADNLSIKISVDGMPVPVTVYPKQFDDVVPSYACSIHKSQGSEYERVIICLPSNADIMMQRSLLYTAVTRSRKKVIIIYTGNTLEKSLTTVIQRNTWLGDMLRQVVPKTKVA